jgi:signal transduction histidine kinase
MPIVKKLMDLHGGEIEIDSVPGRGTIVRLILPTAGRPAPAEIGVSER